MLSRKVVFPVVLAAGVAAPYLMSQKDVGQTAKDSLRAAVNFVATDDRQASPFPSEYTFGPKAQNPQVSLDNGYTGPSCADFAEVFRADISPEWVTQRWPRVTTITAETGLEGLRVPLMTGIRLDDLAGTLTYYFDRNHQVQRLAFDGFTGDERRLVTLLTQAYGLQPEPTLDAGMYVTRWNATPTSVMRISRAPIITAATTHAQLHIQLELNRPSYTYSLSAEFQQLLNRDRNSRRW
jgi:hypothetical protein